ncbi:MAG TPA: hypothetical protein VNS09_04905 [Solirubrobacter sp.]|nr:hypothetical protein [Solirubrobacter sp.]
MTLIDRHTEAIATLRAFRSRSNARRAVLLLHTDAGLTAMLDADPNGVELTEGDDVAFIPNDAPVPATPRPLPEIREVPASAIHIDTTTGQLSAPIGTIDHLADITRALAATFGGLTVATAEFATHGLPITFAAREGEPVVLQAGDEQFELQ